MNLKNKDNDKKSFEGLQNRMESQALQYKDTDLDAFYRFIIGEISFTECVDDVAEIFESSK